MRTFVFSPNHVGRERRRRLNKRLFERRQVDASDLTPSLAVALKQLSMRVMELRDPNDNAAFVERLGAVQGLADECGEDEVALLLGALVNILKTTPIGEATDVADDHIREALTSLTLAPTHERNTRR